MNKKLVFFDVDGTLLNNKQLSDYSIEVLKELVELEKWLYQRLNFDYETLESIRDILEKKVDQMRDLSEKILILRITHSCQELECK